LGRIEGSAVERREKRPSFALPGYERLEGGALPVVHPPSLVRRAEEVRDLLEVGTTSLSELIGVDPPMIEALLVADEDWEEAPRENACPYPPGLPYFTRAASPPLVVLPMMLSPAFRPRGAVMGTLVVWHELAHAFVLRNPLPRTPVWLREFLPQALSAAVARRAGVPLDEHVKEIDRDPGFTIRHFGGRPDAAEQMAFQNLLLVLGAAAVEAFGEGFLRKLVHALWNERDVVGEDRAEELLATSLGPGGREWLLSREEF
jgi:hypothetical protein